MNQKSVRLTSTLTALSALAAAVVAIVAVNSSGLLSAQSATTTIDLLNVGMCVTTDDSVFKEADCDDGDGGNTFTVGDRDEIVERETVFATYAYDPISSGNRPRAILENSDLVKVTVTDKGRDRRRSVLYPAAIDGSTDYGLLLDSSAGAPVVARIKELIDGSDFADMLTDEDNISGFESDDITLYQPRGMDGAAIIANSGTAGLNFRRESGSTDDFLPLSDDEENDVVLFFGFEVNEASADGPELADVDDVAGVQAQLEHLDILGAGSSETLLADEDRSSGGGNTPPWLVVQANVPNNKDLVIVAVLYETSDQEVIVGGARCDQVDGTEDDRDCLAMQGNTRPVFTKSETDNARALIARVRGDGFGSAENLYLKETGRFTGKYTGYVRITDRDGNGPRDVNDALNANERNWGLESDDGSIGTERSDGTPGIDGAAVIRASVGPVTITYRDSNGATRTMSIAVDVTPPTIEIATPEHNSSGDDTSPDFIGTFQDGGGGLAEDTFKLYVDNKTDGGQGEVGDRLPDGENADAVLDIPSGITLKAGKTVAVAKRDYAAPSGDQRFGLIDGRPAANVIYFATEAEADTGEKETERKIANADTYEDGDSQGTFDNDPRIEGYESNGREIGVDFQGVVIDMAGNVGFSDSEKGKPSYIDDLGTTPSLDRQVPNVLGTYSRHVIFLDDKDPEFLEDNTVTGYYDVNDDDEPVPHRRGIMITFDNDINPANITANTFEVELDDESKAEVERVKVKDNLVFLRLVSDLGSSETPEISIASGRRVEDYAGNQLHAREVDAFEAKDGVPPTLTVSLSKGSAKPDGTGDETPASLTRNTIAVTVTSDERLGAAPYVSALCGNFQYTEDASTKKIDDYIAARSGPITGLRPAPDAVESPKCGTATFTPSEDQMGAGSDSLEWQYTWNNGSGTSAVPEGEVRVLVFGFDRSQYKIEPGDAVANTRNWGSVTTKFTFDNTLKPLVKGGTADTTAGTVIPSPNADVTEQRPFIMLYFEEEGRNVEIEKLQVDDVDVTARVDRTEKNRFVYWPEGLNRGTHTVEVDASDAAGNETTFKYEFEKVSRSPFVLSLYAGWNAISLPQQPVDGSLESALSDPAITQVIRFERTSDDDPGEWHMATRQGGVWTQTLNSLTNIEAGPGYWVRSEKFVSQSILLQSSERLNQNLPTVPVRVRTYDGWNFVGAVDQDGDQTQDHFGVTLDHYDSDLDADVPQTGRLYLGNYVRAYTWDAIRSSYEELEQDRSIYIGDGIWVFYGEGVAP